MNFDEIYYEELGMCGCGMPEEVRKLIFDLLEIQSLEFEVREKKRKKIIEECEYDAIIEFIFHYV